MKMIGIYGEMESGKDTVGSILVRDHHYYRVSIGDHIRREILECHQEQLGPMVPLTVLRTLKGIKNSAGMRAAVHAKPTTPEIREALQWFGQHEFDRYPQHWLAQVRRELAQTKRTKVVFTDVRRPNEYDFVSGQGGEMWMTVKATELKQETIHKHITECGLRNYSFKQYISNNGSVPDLERLVKMIVREYGL
jgi:hypothetical protein